MPAILEVKNLTKHFPITHGFLKRVTGWLKAVDGVDFTVQPGETFGLLNLSIQPTVWMEILGTQPRSQFLTR
jgi:ABC-type oligopeptide transport system ATPase subunit